MDYYINKLDWSTKIDRKTFYSRKRRKDSTVTAVIGWKNGEKAIIAYILKKKITV